eukprot:2239173-Amphidinium_carterae.1
MAQHFSYHLAQNPHFLDVTMSCPGVQKRLTSIWQPPSKLIKLNKCDRFEHDSIYTRRRNYYILYI